METMTVREVATYATEQGLRCDHQTVKRRWMEGFYIHPKTGEKIWYFPDHSKLEFADDRLGGYTFNKGDVKKWVESLIKQRTTS